MGLYLKANSSGWYISYGGFQALRDVIAEAAGFDRRERYKGRFSLNTLQGYWIDMENFDVMNSGLPTEGLDIAEDDLDYLMLHSDCDGILPAFAAGKVAVRLSDLVYKIKDEHNRERVHSLSVFLRQAGEDGSLVEFL